MKNILIVIFGLVAMISCQQSEIGQTPMDSVPPGVVTNVLAENLPGAVKLTCGVPPDDDFLYVIATYQVNETLTREAISSYHSNELLLEGFGEAKAYKVKIVAVDRSKNRSNPIEVTVNPGTPPIYFVQNSFKLSPAFGGVNLKWDNESGKEMNIFVMVNDTINTGYYKTEQVLYTSTKTGNISIRGFETKLRSFAVIIYDRWGNCSDTLKADILPLYEQELDYTLIKYLPALSSVGYYGTYSPSLMWDNNIKNTFLSTWPAVRLINQGVYFTIDLGKKTKLSRLKIWPRLHADGRSYAYNHVNVKRYLLWGSNNPSTNMESFDGWTNMGEYQVIKPSGLPIGQLSDEDLAAQAAGFEHVIPDDAEPYRYLRFQLLETWSGGDAWEAAEWHYWGKYVD